MPNNKRQFNHQEWHEIVVLAYFYFILWYSENLSLAKKAICKITINEGNDTGKHSYVDNSYVDRLT